MARAGMQTTDDAAATPRAAAVAREAKDGTARIWKILPNCVRPFCAQNSSRGLLPLISGGMQRPFSRDIGLGSPSTNSGAGASAFVARDPFAASRATSSSSSKTLTPGQELMSNIVNK
jgi:hypothetical protein